ncbi:scarecrow-like protein 27 [Musa acuminata AAA Group]|uniref:scarecrow-like protein 27 n=1 Tax=Musa acuminata AAA Group TaxID=214697 RepID=UPI0031E0E2EB
MRGLPYHGQGKGGLEAVETIFEGNQALFWVNKRPKLVIQQGREPRSVLDHRSPSPPTSTATLSSSLGGGSSDTAGVAAVSDIPTNKWVLADSTAEESGGAVGKEEWAAELQPIPTGLDMGFVAGGEKCGLGVDDWEAILSDTSAASPGREQTFFRWIMGDVDDPSAAGFKQHQQQFLSHGSVEFDGNSNGLGFGILDPGIGLASIGRTADEASVSAPTDSSLPLSSNVASGGGFSLVSSSSRVSPAIVHANIKGATFGHQTGSQFFSLPPQAGNSISSPLSLPQGMYFPDTVLDKPQLFGPGLLLNQASATPNPPFFLSAGHAEQQQLPQLLPPTQLKRHPAIADQIPQKLPFLDSAANSDLFLRRQSYQQQSHGFPLRQLQNRSVKPKVAAFVDDVTSAVAAQQLHLQHALADLLFEAAKMVEARNFVGAHGILARLNHQLPSPSPSGKPLIRSAFYFKEALQLILSNGSNTVLSATPTSHRQQSTFSAPLMTHLDVVHKLNAYKAFSEVSPIIQFSNFTCIQALLEELDGCDRIHIMDFDIGFGGQWSSFMQELAQRRCSSAGAVRMLKITVFVSHYSHNNMELHLIQDNLSHFASDLNIPFELKVHSLDSFDPLELHGLGGEAIAVNLPIGSANLSFPVLLRLVKQLSPKIVVSVDQGCDRSDLPFLQHFLHAFQSSLVLMDSIDASGTNQDTASKIERFLLQPKIESSVLGRYRAADKMLPWRTLFETAGFVPIQFSNFTETQADCLLKRVQIRGFHVEKRQASLYLYWQRKELVSVSAWRG